MHIPDRRVVPDGAALAAAVADRIVDVCRSTLQSREAVHICLAGGNTPRAAYRLLAMEPRRSRIRWEAVQVYWGDERAVPPDHVDSNYRMAREALLEHVPIAASRIHRMEAEDADLAAAAVRYEATLRRHLPHDADGVVCFDLVLLGVGTDGHTASLFPGTPALDVADRLCTVGVAPTGQPRLTLTYPVFDAAAAIVVAAGGADKAPVVRAVFDGGGDMPVAWLRPKPGSLVWLIDRAAAGVENTA